MRVIAVVFAVLLTGVALTTPAQAQQLKKGTLTGEILSKTWPIQANSSATMFTTPTKGFFVLTQLCVENKNNVTVRGATVGLLLFPGDEKCTTYNPGIAFPQNEAITCVNDGASASSCLITGVITNK